MTVVVVVQIFADIILNYTYRISFFGESGSCKRKWHHLLTGTSKPLLYILSDTQQHFDCGPSGLGLQGLVLVASHGMLDHGSIYITIRMITAWKVHEFPESWNPSQRKLPTNSQKSRAYPSFARS